MKKTQWAILGVFLLAFMAIGAIDPFSPKRPIDMGGNQINNLAAATSNNDAVRKVDAFNMSNAASGTLAVDRGGTGQTSYTNGQILIGNTTGNTLTKSTLTAGEGITITNGAGSITLAQSRITQQAKSGGYTVISSDHGTLIRFSGASQTASLTSAATLGEGFMVWLVNSSANASQVVTIDPSGAETIDFKSTLDLYRGQSIQIMSDGSNWRVIGAVGFSRAFSHNTLSTATQPTATGTESVVVGPYSVASGDYAVAIGANTTGVGALSSGVSSLALMGGEAVAASALAFGDYVTSRSTRGAKAFGNGRITTTGDAQFRMQQVRGQTTTATPLVITADASSASSTTIFRMPNNSTYTFRVMVTGHRTDTTGRASYVFEGCITRDANAASTAMAASTKTVVYETTASYDATVTADTTNGGLIVTVTGASGHTMTWVAHIEAAEATS